MAQKIDIINSGLLMVGANIITSLDDETKEAVVANRFYGTTYRSLLQQSKWRFSLDQTQLAQLQQTPKYGFDHAYQLPSDNLRVISVKGSPDYEIYGDFLYTDEDEVYITYQFEPAEDDLPDYFIRALEYKLAEVFAVPLLDDLDKVSTYNSLASDEVVRARNIDAQSQPTNAVPQKNYTLVNTRN